MSDKINVFGIVRAHLHTLRHHGRDDFSAIDFTIFVICPLFLAVVVFLDGDSLGENLVNAMINAAAILLGLLLNLLVLMFDQRNRAVESLRKYKPVEQGGGGMRDADGTRGKLVLRIEVIKQTVANISFTVLLCIVSLASLLVYSMRQPGVGPAGCVESTIYALNAFIWVSVFLIILMVVKRVFALFVQTA